MIAALNGPESVVISGYKEELGRVEDRLRDEGIRVQRLRGSHGFHSPQMREMEEAFEALAAEVRFARPRLPVVSSVTGRPVGPEEMSHAGYWRRQVSQPVRYRQAMESLRDQGGEVFLEVGPGTTLGLLGRESLGEAGQLWLSSLRRGRGEWEQTLESLGRLYTRGAEVNWPAFDEPYARRRVPLPTYPFERQPYWMDRAHLRRTPESGREGAREIRDQAPKDPPGGLVLRSFLAARSGRRDRGHGARPRSTVALAHRVRWQRSRFGTGNSNPGTRRESDLGHFAGRRRR